MKKASCVYCIDAARNKVLMAEQQYKIIGLKGYGGGFDPERGDKTMEDCAGRELDEEGCIPIKKEKLELVGRMAFYNGPVEEVPDGEPSFEVWFYRYFDFLGTAVSTDEMKNPDWYDIDNLPIEEMIVGDDLFIPQILRGELIKGWIRRTKDLKQVIDYHLEPCTIEDLAFE